MHREDAWQILLDYTQEERTRKHGIAVEAVMQAYARLLHEDEEKWGIVGLLHDFDWEIHPTEELHPMEGSKLLAARGVPEDIRYAILCHAPFLGLEYRSTMDRAIYACDELSGFVIACALVKPDRSLSSVEPASVRKKMKDKAFARSVRREDLVNGARDLGVDLDEHIRFVTDALKPVAHLLGVNP
ncbi:MAG: HDIG domain-containing protein [Tepidiforma sp.]|jgi:predicted hydrolase (HD superfamily)|uniref:HD domain-containing protein n=1 Tax=Tepidiforma sp. TaxID=2682230 RepID=UPI0021DD3636|nr:HD domain-containing protein [Tepidiforma sp.]GIW16077.1 MAG: HDIG domain-containing protein [Tepidiforma sp.]